jgi:PAS domain S-box-containing protein
MPEPSDTVTIQLGALQALAWFYENSEDGFLAVQGDTVRRVNPVWTRMTGYSATETDGQSFWSFLLAEDAQAMQADVAGLPARGEIEGRRTHLGAAEAGDRRPGLAPRHRARHPRRAGTAP